MDSASPTKLRFASPWLVLVFLVFIFFLLFFLFPKKNILEKIEKQHLADRAARDYISCLIAMHPSNNELKIIHADQNIKLGKIANAIKEVFPLVTDQPKTEIDWKALWLYYQIIRTETYALPHDSPARLSGLTKMQTLFDKLLLYFTTSYELEILAIDAISLNKNQTALDLYHRIINLSLDGDAKHYAQIAKFALSQQDYKLSADFYFVAENRAINLKTKRDYFILGLKSLQSGNFLNDAVVIIEKRINNLSKDNITLIFLTKLLLAANRPDLAEISIKKIITPCDEFYLLAYDTFLANQHIEEAYKITKLAIKVYPNDFIWRQRYAQIATWNNDPKIALDQWLYIATNQINPIAVEEGIKIAKELNDYFALSTLLRLKMKYSKKEEFNWRDYIKTEERLGNTQNVIDDLLAIIKTEAKPFYFEELVSLYNTTGNSEAEFETLNLIASKFGMTTKIALRQSEMLYSEGKIIEAQRELANTKNFAKNSDFEFWRTLGGLSWIAQDFSNAKIAYEKLKENGKLDQYSLINFIQLTQPTDEKKAFALALTGWFQYKMDYFLLKILELTPKLNEWQKLVAIIASIPQDVKVRMEKNLLYYTVTAQLFTKYNKRQQAIAIYNEALQKLDNSIELKTDFLWFLINNEYTGDLRQKLIAWENIVYTDINFSNAYAVGCILLGDTKAAMSIYKKQFTGQQYDEQWLIDLTSTIDQLSGPAETTLMREIIWRSLMQQLPMQLPKEYEATTDIPATSDNFEIDSGYLKAGHIYGLQEKVGGALLVTQRISISPWVTTWQTNSDDNSQILRATYLDRSFGIKINQQHKHGETTLNIGQRHGLDNFIMLALNNSYNISNKLNLILSLGYQQTADETTPLLIAGMKNEIKIEAEYRLAEHDNLTSNFYYKNFNSQDNAFLGRGQILDIYYKHKFKLKYPDWTVNLFSSINRYQDSGSVSYKAQDIIPINQTHNASFFIPTSFIRYGAGFGFGQSYRDTYTNTWRPFAEVSLFEDTGGIGVGNYLDIGLAGSVFGRDHIVFYYERSNSLIISDQVDYIYGMRYKINF